MKYGTYTIRPPQPPPSKWETRWKKLLFNLHLRNSYPYSMRFKDGPTYRASIIRIKELEK